MTLRTSSRRLCAALVGALAATAILPAVTEARMSVIYELNSGQAALLGSDPPNPDALFSPQDQFADPSRPTYDNAFQQQPTGSFLNGRAKQAAKVAGAGTGTNGTASLTGRTAAEIEALLVAEIERASYDQMVFIDELRPEHKGAGGDALRDAMRAMVTEPSPSGAEQNLARHVHIYLPAPELLTHQPDEWASAWEAIALSGGVWLEAYRPRRGIHVWRPEEWLTYGRTFPSELERRGGSRARVHFLMTTPGIGVRAWANEPDSQAEQWRWARTGAACSVLANGPGTWQAIARKANPDPPEAGGRAAEWLKEFRAVFGARRAPAGPQAISCLPQVAPAPGRVASLATAIARAQGTLSNRIRLRHPVWAGRRSGPITAILGPDPGGIAGALGIAPEKFWGSAAARVVVRPPGGSATAFKLRSSGNATIGFHTSQAGFAGLRLVIPGRSLQEAVSDQPIDLALALAPFEPQLDGLIDTIARKPSDWALNLPLGRGIHVRAVPTPATVTSIATSRVGPAETRDLWRRDPRKFEVIRLRARSPQGIVPFAPLVIRGPGGRVRRVRTDASGVASVASRKNGRRIRIASPDSGTQAVTVLRRRSIAKKIGIREAGRRAVRDAGRDARQWRRFAIVVRGRRGERIPMQPLVAQYGVRAARRIATNARGLARMWVPRKASGRLRVKTADRPRIRAAGRLL